MRFKLLAVVGIAVSLAQSVLTFNASAQSSGVYKVFTGGTTIFPASSTNKYVVGGVTNVWGAPGSATNTVQTVGDYDYVGLTWGFTGTATSTNDLLVYKSFDNGVTFETNPSFTYTNIAPGAAAFVTNASLDVHAVTHIAIVSRSRGTTDGTNQLVEFNLKMPRVQSTPATR